MPARSKVHAARIVLNTVRMRQAYVAHISKIHLVHSSIAVTGKKLVEISTGNSGDYICIYIY
jgi:hypothetical protein